VANTKSNDSTSVFLAHLIVLCVLLVVFVFSYMTYIDTLWMKEEIKKEARELRKLKEELKKELE
jgi:flagellar biosynthesis protein FlhB